MPSPPGGELEKIPLSAINQYLFCPRRAALIHVEGIFKDNQHTLRGDIVHEHADLAGYDVVKGVTLLRALPVWSERLGLSGKCDIIEVEANPKAETRNPKSLRPVEFKLGKRRQWENDDAQLCAQALCLEEMFGVAIPRGAIFHADSKRRREVEFTAELRRRTEQAVTELHALLRGSEIPDVRFQTAGLPPAEFKPACEECSLFDICQPKATESRGRIDRLARQLFAISDFRSRIPTPIIPPSQPG
jgi:CRISPR-associated exonuclease Cas4